MSDRKLSEVFVLYIKKNKKVILFYVFAAVFIIFILSLDGIDIRKIVYSELLITFIGATLSILGFIRFYNKVRCLRNEMVPKQQNTLEREYTRRIEKLEREIFLMNSDLEREKREMMDFYTMWVHQIKTPIAAIHLLLQDKEAVYDGYGDELEGELFKIEQYVEMVLSYLRMESKTTDYVIKKYPVDILVKQAVRKFAKQFIRKKIRVELRNLEGEIITDEKWFSFVLEQLLLNALKYTNQGKISIYLNENHELVMEDTGIGIDKTDLPRIFEKGFTGYNGRINNKSTGLGLYLCKTILSKIGAGIRAESVVGQGTKIVIDLKQADTIIE